MERIFKAVKPEEIILSDIIMNDRDQKTRRKALNKLRSIYGASLTSLRSIEYYRHIPGQPSYYKRFDRAVIMYDDTKIKIS